MDVELAATRRFKKPGENLIDNVRFSFSVLLTYHGRDSVLIFISYLPLTASLSTGNCQYVIPLFLFACLPMLKRGGLSVSAMLGCGELSPPAFRQFPLSQLRFPLPDRRISCSVAVISVSSGSTTRHRIPTIGINRLHPLTRICRYLFADHGLDNERLLKLGSAEWR
ncbi:hypothetical protein BJX65DRAFT_11668 [Aspergillus insuetus]